jgi:hypothetical protein
MRQLCPINAYKPKEQEMAAENQICETGYVSISAEDCCPREAARKEFEILLKEITSGLRAYARPDNSPFLNKRVGEILEKIHLACKHRIGITQANAMNQGCLCN